MPHYFYFFLQGLITGIIIAAIGGPVGILCIKRTLVQGSSAGIALGIGAALADALFGSISGFGLTVISDFLLNHKKIINLIGSCFLIYLGIATFNDKIQEDTCDVNPKNSFLKNILTSFFITLTNPATILFFAAMAIGLGVGIDNYTAAALMVTGIFIGSLAWFSSLALFITMFQTKISKKQFTFMNKFFGIGLLLFGLYVGLRALL